jgi:chromosome partitioning protein
MRKICVATHKGGTGKSTTCINLGAALVKLGKRVLLVDTDAQGHTTLGLGIKTGDSLTLAELLCDDDVSVEDVIRKTYVDGLDIIPSDISLAVAESRISNAPAKEFKLRNKLKNITGYDFILFDCGPTFGTMQMNVFNAADSVILPMQLGYFALEGVNNFIETIQFINKTMGPVINHEIKLEGVLITFFDTRTKLSQEVLATIKEVFGEKLFHTAIPQNVKLNEAQSRGLTIMDYDSDSKGSIAYINLAKELLGVEA